MPLYGILCQYPMAPKEKLVKGQRAISSFFFKKPEDKPSSHQKHVLGIPAAPQPPNKRQKRDSSQHKAAVDDSQVNGTPSGLTDAQIEQPDEPEPIDLTEAPQEHSGHPSRGAKPGAAGRRKPAPYDKDAQHQRFQNKLVLGPASGLERDKTVVPQKTTPLEDQVYALKRKHPGILLLIEVCVFCIILHHQLMHTGHPTDSSSMGIAQMSEHYLNVGIQSD